MEADKVSKPIIGYLVKNGKSSLGDISRTLRGEGVGTGMEIRGKLESMAVMGLLKASLKETTDDDDRRRHVRAWTRYFEINKRRKEEAEDLLREK